MIKIQEHLNVIRPNNFLNDLAEKLWTELNPRLADNSDHKVSSIIKKCHFYLNETAGIAYCNDYAGGIKATAKRHHRFFLYLTKKNDLNLKSIIVAKPRDFDKIKTEILGILREEDLYTMSGEKVEQTKFGKLISEKIFDYKRFRQSTYCIDLFTKLKFHSATCPYCNYNILHIVNINLDPTKERKRRAYLDLDHFYPKSRNPFFSLSFFNLVPSCHSCNSSDKGEKPFGIKTHIHPYLESFDDIYTFQISAVTYVGATAERISIVNNGKKLRDRTLDDLLLVQRYQDRLKDMTDLIYHYKKYKGHMKTSSRQSFLDAFFEVRKVPRTRTDILQTPHGKLLRDILKDVDKVNNYLNLQ
jgi:5-methylcytosine-specific restriction endonuclease McrA